MSPDSRTTVTSADWRSSPTRFLMAITFVNFLAYASWNATINNFAAESAGLSWQGIGLMQSVREIPGLLAFTAIFWITFLREQTFAYLSMILLCLGVAITGYFPDLTGILLTTFLMSVGFHYLETMNQSLSLQLLKKETAAIEMGKIASAGAAAQFTAYGGLAVLAFAGVTDYRLLFLIFGGAATAMALFTTLSFRRFDGPVPQRKSIVLRRRYWLYYALTLVSGARRQIFAAFAAYLLVKTFGYKIEQVALLFLLTAAINTVLARKLGALIARIGERRSIMIENISLIAIFAGYALAANGWLGTLGPPLAALLFVLDGTFTTFIIAQKTYFQKVGDPEDMAPTAAVAFTINHIMAVFIPVVFGLLAVRAGNPAIIFWLGCGIATASLSLSFLVPDRPGPGRETRLSAATSWRAAE